GLSFMPHGRLLLADFDQGGAPARGWLADILPKVAFDDGRRLDRDAVLTLALGPHAMAKAGLSDTALETFPAAFLDGMRHEGRAKILGDQKNELTWWADSYDVAVLVYGKSDEAVLQLSNWVVERLAHHGHRSSFHAVDLVTVDKSPSRRLEPFGFV